MAQLINSVSHDPSEIILILFYFCSRNISDYDHTWKWWCCL